MSWDWLGGLWVCLGTCVACFIVYCLSCWGLYFVFGCSGYLDCFPVAVVCLMRCDFCGGVSARGYYLLLFVYLCAAFVVIGSYRGLLWVVVFVRLRLVVGCDCELLCCLIYFL